MPSEIRVDKVSSTASPYTPVFSTTGGALSHRNVIINGGMQVWQRRPSYSGTVDVSNGTNETYNSVDRFKPTFGNACSGGVSWSRSTEVPDIAGGDYFYDSLKVQTYSVNSSPNTTKHASIDYLVEAHDMQRFGWGKTNKKDAVLSFYFKTSKTGVYSFYFETPGTGTRRRTISFTVSDTNWNRYSIALTADTVAIPDANTYGLLIQLNLINVPDYQNTSGTDSGWGTAVKMTDDDQVNFLDNASNILYLTGMQLELGSVATPFENRSYADELRRCQRYCAVFGNGSNGAASWMVSGCANSSTSMYCNYRLPVPPRTIPSTTLTGQFIFSDYYAQDHTFTSPTISTQSQSGEIGGRIYLSGMSGLTSSRFMGGQNGLGGTGKAIFTMEL